MSISDGLFSDYNGLSVKLFRTHLQDYLSGMNQPNIQVNNSPKCIYRKKHESIMSRVVKLSYVISWLFKLFFLELWSLNQTVLYIKKSANVLLSSCQVRITV